MTNQECPTCGGEGIVTAPCPDQARYGKHVSCLVVHREQCPECHGTGRIPTKYKVDQSYTDPKWIRRTPEAPSSDNGQGVSEAPLPNSTQKPQKSIVKTIEAGGEYWVVPNTQAEEPKNDYHRGLIDGIETGIEVAEATQNPPKGEPTNDEVETIIRAMEDMDDNELAKKARGIIESRKVRSAEGDAAKLDLEHPDTLEHLIDELINTQKMIDFGGHEWEKYIEKQSLTKAKFRRSQSEYTIKARIEEVEMLNDDNIAKIIRDRGVKYWVKTRVAELRDQAIKQEREKLDGS